MTTPSRTRTPETVRAAAARELSEAMRDLASLWRPIAYVAGCGALLLVGAWLRIGNARLESQLHDAQRRADDAAATTEKLSLQLSMRRAPAHLDAVSAERGFVAPTRVVPVRPSTATAGVAGVTP